MRPNEAIEEKQNGNNKNVSPVCKTIQNINMFSTNQKKNVSAIAY